MAIKAGWIQAPEPSPKQQKKRCCARCRTQFAVTGGLMCADNRCKCHAENTK